MPHGRTNPGLTKVMVREHETLAEYEKTLDKSPDPNDPALGTTYGMMMLKVHKMLKDKARGYLDDTEIIQVFVIGFTNPKHYIGVLEWKNHNGKTRPFWW